MIEWILISVVIVLLVGVVLALVLWKKRKEEKPQEPDYQAFYTMGIVFIGAGVVFMITINPGFLGIMGLGVAYMIIGLKNKDKWKKKGEKK